MNIFKISVFSLLLSFSFIYSRVQLHIQMELKNSVQFGNRDLDVTIHLNKEESLEIYNNDGIRVVAKLFAEKKDHAAVGFFIYAKNANGQYNLLLDPFMIPNYKEQASLFMGSTSENSKNDESFTIKVDAQRI